MTNVIHRFCNTKLQLWPVINVAKCLTELRHDNNNVESDQQNLPCVKQYL